MQPSSSHQEPPSPAVITPSEDHLDLDLDPLDSNTTITDFTDFTNRDFPFNPSSDREATMDDPHPTITPPPHLAARLYRNRINSARRKSSATSSRRNSMSSVHSHGSSLSHHHHRRASATASGCQSNYIAQHLRRASIIESRKARLADRAAHVEQVRLRGALYKAAPRGSATNSEEKALAAQLAKEKYLAKVAAACAEEVARAKRVAEEVKERKLAEEARARLEMEERHAEAEKRRAEYQRNLQARRARRADSAEKKLAVLDEVVDVDEEGGEAAVVVDGGQAKDSAALSEEEAAARILRRWRVFRRGAPVRAFNAIDLPERVRTMSFDEMTALVADAATIAATTAILMHLGLQDADDENAALNSRTFLSAFMIFAHPVAVLNNQNGAQEQDLIGKASDLIGHFDAVVQRLAPWNNYSPSSTQLETLSQAYSAYTSAFAAWRLQDSSVIIEGMVAAFVELDAIWQTVKDDSRGEVASDYRDGIRDNQVMLLSRIRKLAGPDRADQLIKKAIRESRRRRPRKRPTAEVRPRGVEAASQQQPAAAAASSSTTSTSTSETAAEAAINSVVAPPPALSANLQSSDVSRLFTPMPSNRALTHELAIDKDYRLEDDATTSELRSKLYRSICDSMKRGFEAGEGSRWTVSAAENVREKLLRMLKPGSAMHNLIAETLDLEDVARQSRLGGFSYAGFFSFMASVLPKLCAPFRDAEVKALAEHLQDNNDGNGTATQDLDDMIEKLFKLLRVVDLLSLDYTNFMIMSAAPTLIREAPGYEQRLFARSLETGEISLERTSRWWSAAQAQLTAEADRRDPEGVRRAEDKPSSEKIYATALVNLALDEPGELREERVPETLMLDVDRLREVRARAVRVAVVGAVLLTAKNLLRRDSRAQWKNEGMRLFALLGAEGFAGESSTVAAAATPGATSDGSNGGDAEMQATTTTTTTAQKAFAILETAHNMPPATKTQLSAMIARFFSQAAAATAPTSSSSSPSTSPDPAAAAAAPKFTDPVLKVLYARLRSHILARLSASTAAEKVRAASGASEALAKVGLPEFVGVVGGVVETLERVRRVDWEGHGVWLERVAGEAR